MNDAQKLMTDVLLRHISRYRSGQYECQEPDCDWRGATLDAHAEHQAAEIDKALGGLTAEERTNPMSSAGMTTNYNTGEVISFSDIRRDTRWVSGWSEAKP